MKNYRISYNDDQWDEQQWKSLLENLVACNLLTWKEITALTLGHMNPPQVGTSLASSEGFKRCYGKGNTMRIVMDWFYTQAGRCVDCGTRLELQADHSTPREDFEDPLDADFIENMVLRCRRCNVIRRPSHQFGGNTHLTAEAALMWLLFTFKPRTLKDFIRMCRIYGMTMADIRMQEGWAMAHWLQRASGYTYTLDDSSKPCNLLLWPDGAVTRAWEEDSDRSDSFSAASILYRNISPSRDFAFVAADAAGGDTLNVTFYRYRVADIPFSHYFGDTPHPPQVLAVTYSPPKRNSEKNDGPTISPLPPRAMRLLGHAIVDAEDELEVAYTDQQNRRRTKAVSRSKQCKLGEFSEEHIRRLNVHITTC